MINEIELVDFLSHSDTKIEFNEGVTIFVGQNGAGKSSIIDGITFALFGKHSRKDNKGLVRRGQNQGYSKINFSLNGNSFEAVRKIDSKGILTVRFSEKKNDSWMAIAEGERKQFGESVTKEIESKIGLDFEKLKVAAIVRQGELNSIINAKPREFKELLNAIIGIDRLDIASAIFTDIQKQFRAKIQEELGNDDSDISRLANKLEKYNEDVKEAKPELDSLHIRKATHEQSISEIQKIIDADSNKENLLKELEERKEELSTYSKSIIIEIKKKISENQRKISDCQGCFELINQQQGIEEESQYIEAKITEISKNIQSSNQKMGKFKAQQELAEKLDLKDGKCPVCDSSVKNLNPLFQKQHIKDELDSIENKITDLEQTKKENEISRDGVLQKIQKIQNAKTTLTAHAVNSKEQLVALELEIKNQQEQMSKIPSIPSPDNFKDIAKIDSRARIIYEKILQLQEKTEDFDPTEFRVKKIELEQKRVQLQEIDQKFGALQEKIKNLDDEILKIDEMLEELDIVKQYVAKIENISKVVYSRDGTVAKSLRSWALQIISQNASEYLEKLNTKIHRISLSEKTRDVSITCFSRGISLDIESLSGGEQVSIALALRLGMAQLMGGSNLNFMILDEPTTHLDAERKKSLVNVISQLSGIKENNSMQFIIITHDDELFNDSTVENIYKFEGTNQGTQVISL